MSTAGARLIARQPHAQTAAAPELKRSFPANFLLRLLDLLTGLNICYAAIYWSVCSFQNIMDLFFIIDMNMYFIYYICIIRPQGQQYIFPH